MLQDNTEEWKRKHVLQSQYSLQIRKCKDRDCCSRPRTNFADILPDGYIPPPVPFTRNAKGVMQKFTVFYTVIFKVFRLLESTMVILDPCWRAFPYFALRTIPCHSTSSALQSLQLLVPEHVPFASSIFHLRKHSMTIKRLNFVGTTLCTRILVI